MDGNDLDPCNLLYTDLLDRNARSISNVDFYKYDNFSLQTIKKGGELSVSRFPLCWKNQA